MRRSVAEQAPSSAYFIIGGNVLNVDKLLTVIEQQESSLRFDHFDNDDAWNLGCLIVEDARKKQLAIAVDININGYTVFRYGFSGTNDNNNRWLTRKANTVNTVHKSTLRVYGELVRADEDLESDWHLDPMKFACMGGGFPIFVNGVGVVGSVIVSGLSHFEDHDMVVEGICTLLGKDVERYHE